MVKIFLFSVLFLIINSISSPAEEKKSFSFAIVPMFTPDFIQKNWGPILKEISAKTGYNFEIKIYKTIKDFEQEIFNNSLDFAYVNPFQAVIAYEKSKYSPILRNNSPLLGILVTKKDSPLKTLVSLDGKKVAFASPSCPIYIYLTIYVFKKYNIKINPVFVKTHDNVYRHVLFGLADAGGAVNISFLKQSDEIKNNLHIIYTTPPFGSHPIIVNPRVPTEVVEKFVNAFIELNKNPALKDYFYKIQIPNPVRTNYEKDYKQLKFILPNRDSPVC